MFQGAFGNPADFEKDFPNLSLQLIAALLNPRDDIGLDARTVHFQQIIQKHPGVTLDRGKCSKPAKKYIRKISQRRCGLRNVNQPLKRESRWNAEASIRIQGIRQTRQFRNSRFGEFSEEVTSDGDKARLDPPVLCFRSRLFVFQPRRNIFFGDGLRGTHCVPPELGAIAFWNTRERVRKFSIQFRSRLRKETFPLFEEHVSQSALLRQEQISDIAERHFRLGNCLAQPRHALIRRFHRAQQRISLFGNNRQQLLAQPTKPLVFCGAHQIAPGLHGRRFQRANQLRPISFRTAIFELFLRADFIHGPDRPVEVLLQYFARESLRDLAVGV